MKIIRFSRAAAVGAATVFALATSGCGSSTSGDAPSTEAVSVGPASSADDGAATACLARNTGREPDVFFRFKDPGTRWSAQRLGGGYNFDHATGKCLSGPEFLLATVADGTGHCAEVAPVSANRGYNPDADNPPPLHGVVAEKGDCAGM